MFMLLAQLCEGQVLRDIFFEIPDSYIELNISQRDSLIQNFQNGNKHKSYYWLTKYEPNNGYLKYINRQDESTTLTYWNLDSGRKLIGIVNLKLSNPSKCQIKFLIKTSSALNEIDKNKILPNLSHEDFFDLDEMTTEQIETEVPMFNRLDLIYHLPSNGKNIIVHSQYSEFDIDDRIQKYTRGWDLELIWNNGKFLKGNFID